MITSFEDKILEIILNEQHIYLILGIFSLLVVLKRITIISDFLFSEKWSWIVPILNLVLSLIGIFGLGLTNVETVGMKIIIAFIITAVTTYGYELVKPILEKIINRFFVK
jgi:hypothetical protein